MLRIGIIVQARMSSKRLPGKVLTNVSGKPLLQYIVERLARCNRIQEVVIATSLDKSDDPIEVFCKKNHLSYYRGSLNNVASRFKEISEKKRWDAFVRINGDSPLIDPLLIDKGIEIYQGDAFDLVTNIFPRTFPPGQSIEVVRCTTFENSFLNLSNNYDLEHVTSLFYRNPENFKILNFTSEHDYSNIHLAVDTPEDLHFFSSIIFKMEKPHWEYNVSDIIELLNNIKTNNGGMLH